MHFYLRLSPPMEIRTVLVGTGFSRNVFTKAMDLVEHSNHRLIHLFHKTNRDQTWGALCYMLLGSRCCSAEVPNQLYICNLGMQ